MNPAKSLVIIGFVFLANGVTFLIVGLTAHLKTLWLLGPSFLALGIVLLAIARFRRSAPARPDGTSRPGSAE